MVIYVLVCICSGCMVTKLSTVLPLGKGFEIKHACYASSVMCELPICSTVIDLSVCIRKTQDGYQGLVDTEVISQ